jgi:hypothetical protein
VDLDTRMTRGQSLGVLVGEDTSGGFIARQDDDRSQMITASSVGVGGGCAPRTPGAPHATAQAGRCLRNRVLCAGRQPVDTSVGDDAARLRCSDQARRRERSRKLCTPGGRTPPSAPAFDASCKARRTMRCTAAATCTSVEVANARRERRCRLATLARIGWARASLIAALEG